MRQCALTMAPGKTCTLLLLVLFCAVLLHTSVAKTHIVGGDTGWTLLNITDTFYDDWASKQKFQEDDELLFVYESGTHNVWVVPASDTVTCAFNNALEKYEEGNATVQLYKAGKYGFVCQYPGHCSRGMKMTLTAAAAPPAPPGTSEPSESPPAPPTETPEPPSDSPPSPPSAATRLRSLHGLVVGGLIGCIASALIS